MEKYRVRCQAETGKIISEYFIEARNVKDAALKNHAHPEYEKSMDKAMEKGIYGYQFVIDPVNTLN